MTKMLITNVEAISYVTARQLCAFGPMINIMYVECKLDDYIQDTSPLQSVVRNPVIHDKRYLPVTHL
jgi:hypothetical protein